MSQADVRPADKSFVCPHCGETHEGFPTDYGYTLPDDVWAIPEEDRPSKAKWNTDLCQLGERYFIRCLLPVQFTDQPGYFGWGLWAEVTEPVFKRYLDVYDKDAAEEQPYPATLANQPPRYESTLGVPLFIKFGSSTQRPTMQFPASSEHLLAWECAHGINSERYHRILEAMGVIRS